LDELEEKYNLIYHFRAGDADIEKILSLAENSELKKDHQIRCQQMLDDKTDVTAWIVNFLESMA
jgi:predicted glycosyltransferase